MTTTAQNVKYRRQLAKLEASRRNADKVKMLPREVVVIVLFFTGTFPV